jgi:hypothetical protein
MVDKPQNTALFLIKYRVYLIYFSHLFIKNCSVSGAVHKDDAQIWQKGDGKLSPFYCWGGCYEVPSVRRRHGL